MIAISLLILASATQSLPGADVIARYENSRKVGTGLCFESLATGDVQTGAKIIQGGTNASDLCGCVGELFATGVISEQLKIASLASDPASRTKQKEVLANLAVICTGRLTAAIPK